MKYSFVVILMGLSLSMIAQDYSQFEKKNFQNKEGESLPYRILFPQNYDQSLQYPLVVFLHGAGERGADNESQLKHGVKAFLDSTARKQFPAIVIAPQCPKDGYWGSVKVDRSEMPLKLDFNYRNPTTEALDLAIQLTKQVLKEEAVDKKRVYITGLSMGGMGTLEAIYKQPNLFAAAVAVCGGADISAYGKKQAKFPIWLFHGNADVVVEVEHSQALYDKLKKMHGKIKYTEYQGVNHNSWEKAYAEPELLPWLFKQSR